MITWLKCLALRLLLSLLLLNGLHPSMAFKMALPVSDYIGFHLFALKLSRVGQTLKIKFTGNQTLAYSYVSTATLRNAEKTVLHRAWLVLYLPQQKLQFRMREIALYFQSLRLSQGSHRFHQ